MTLCLLCSLWKLLIRPLVVVVWLGFQKKFEIFHSEFWSALQLLFLYYLYSAYMSLKNMHHSDQGLSLKGACDTESPKKLIGLSNLIFQAAHWAHNPREYEIYDTNSIPKLICQKDSVAAFLMTIELCF